VPCGSVPYSLDRFCSNLRRHLLPLPRSSDETLCLDVYYDDIFKYVEKKGMEMNLSVTDAKEQASFMLAALREMRKDEKARKKKKAEAEGDEEVTIIGPLLGPACKEDKDGASPPPDFGPPDNLEDVNFEMDVPVGYRRLRWAVLHKDSDFMELAVMKTESKHENITIDSWSKHNDEIGLHKTPDGIDEADFVGATIESSYLMPSSAFVKANMAYETATIAQYSDYCLCINSTHHPNSLNKSKRRDFYRSYSDCHYEYRQQYL